MIQAFRAGETAQRLKFSNAILRDMEDHNFLLRSIFSDEATFHISGKVNCHNVRMWKFENPQEILEHLRLFPKVNLFCAVFLRKVYRPFILEENTILGLTYLEMLQQ